MLYIPAGRCVTAGGGPRYSAYGPAVQLVRRVFFFSLLHLMQHELWRVLLMATGSTMTHYCDWAISILIQPASQSGRLSYGKHWAGCALALHFSLSPVCPWSFPSIYLWMHLSSPLLLKIKSHYCACVRRAACVTLAHSAGAKNIPSDVVVMQ